MEAIGQAVPLPRRVADPLACGHECRETEARGQAVPQPHRVADPLTRSSSPSGGLDNLHHRETEARGQA
eukprot:11531094-Heterocapsa_arctica.AAC.1